MRTSTQTVPEATIHVARHPRDLEGLVPDPGLGAFFGYAVRAPERTLDGIRRALLHGGRAVLARRGPVVVGYLTLSRPDADQPWGRVPGLLVRLFEDSGFSLEATNEPNIVMDPHNFLAVRVGSRVPPAQVDRFRATLFSTRAA